MLGEDGEDWRSVVRFMTCVGCVPLLMICVGCVPLPMICVGCVPLPMICVGCVPLLMTWVGCVKKGEEHGMLSDASSSISSSSTSNRFSSLLFWSCLFMPGVPGTKDVPPAAFEDGRAISKDDYTQPN